MSSSDIVEHNLINELLKIEKKLTAIHCLLSSNNTNFVRDSLILDEMKDTIKDLAFVINIST